MADVSLEDQKMANQRYEQFRTALRWRTEEEVNARVEYARQVARDIDQFTEAMIDHYGT